MPEGPEVEIVRRGLKRITGQTIRAIAYSNREKYSQQASLFSDLLGTSLRQIVRRGKWLLFTFENSMGALNHLGMSGRWFVYESEVIGQDLASFSKSQTLLVDFRGSSITEKLSLFEKLGFSVEHPPLNALSHGNTSVSSNPVEGQEFFHLNKHGAKISTSRKEVTHEFSAHPFFSPHIQLMFILDGSVAIFEDVRTFGYFRVYSNSQTMFSLPSLQELGPDILDKAFDIKEFEKRLKKYPRSVICAKLLDPKVIAGCGNIYRNEALFLAKLNPFRKIGNLDKSEIHRLAKALVQVGATALNYGGSSIQSFANAEGARGRMQERFLVYGKAGFPCPSCSSVIQKTKFQQRSVYWCSQCQE